MLELSRATNCPPVSYQLAGCKKFQQVIASPGNLEKYEKQFIKIFYSNMQSLQWCRNDKGNEGNICRTIYSRSSIYKTTIKMPSCFKPTLYRLQKEMLLLNSHWTTHIIMLWNHNEKVEVNMFISVQVMTWYFLVCIKQATHVTYYYFSYVFL